MAPSRIVIIDEEPGQQLGAQLRAVLQRERHCVVDLIESRQGNIRELQNVIQQVVVSTDGDTIEPEDLPISPPRPSRELPGAPFKQAKGQAIARFERAYLTELLRVHQGNVSQAARAAQKERRAFGRLIKKYHLVAR